MKLRRTLGTSKSIKVISGEEFFLRSGMSEAAEL